MMRKFAAGNIEKLIKAIPCAVYAPVVRADMTVFERYEDGDQLDFKCCNTDKSPKDIMFPQWEDLMHFRMEGRTIELTEQERCKQDFVIFGIRACDIRALEALDRVFLADPIDTYYAARREHGILVGMACSDPEDTCFCTNFGIDPAAPEADVVLWRRADEYYARAYTEKGAKLLAVWDTDEADEADIAPVKAEIRARINAKPFAHLNMKGIDGDHLNEMFNSPKWEKLSMACLGCGSCTFVCPTCQCYDIRDYDSGHGVQRYRCWDSCMYSDFTLMAATNPRTTQMQRYRQRFMHKLCYFPANNDGMYSCVGCGRCVRKCPMNLNIVKVIKALAED